MKHLTDKELGDAIRRSNAREDAFWRTRTDRPRRAVAPCPLCGIAPGHHPRCPDYDEARDYAGPDTDEEARGER